MSIYSDVVNSTHEYEVLTGAGAVSVVKATTFLVTTAADALTLANAQIGQQKFITMATDGGDATLTPTSPIGFATIVFTAVGQWVILRYNGRGWEIKASYGVTIA